MLRNLLQRASSLIQGGDSSYKRHHNQMEDPLALSRLKDEAFARIQNNDINDAELRVDELLQKYPLVDTTVDIGSGAGWASGAMSSRVKSITAIEPSVAGVNMAKEIFAEDKFSNITWRHGLAEEILPTLELRSPTLFLTGCVLSHLRDAEVIKICTAVSKIAPDGSILAFAECWGEKPWHQLMWHVRTKDWWQEQLPEWELTFHGPQVAEKDEYKGIYHKGFWGVRKV